MLVKSKATGRMGNIPDDKFDPSLFEPATQQKQQPIVQQPVSQQGLTGLLGQVLNPFIRSGKNIAGAGYELVRAGQSALGNKDVYNKENPFLNQEDLQKFDSGKGAGLQNILGNKGVNQQLKDSANIGSWAIPFGKGAGIVQKAILPGAVVGGMQGYSKEGATGESIIKDIITGGATAGVLQKGGDILGGLLKGTGKVATNVGAGAREGVRQIRQPASIWGSGKEKQINKTLNDLGITGSPSKQYSLLEPKMNLLEGKIQKVITDNPTVVVTKSDIKKSFMDNLKSAMRSKDITNKQAQQEVDGYLMDLIKASGGKGKFTDINLSKLRELKKLVNDDYGAVFQKMERGIQPLTSREKVVAAAWDSLDSAVKTASPEMKKLLSQESNLYKAAPSLSGARSTPPTLRALGTSLPSGITQTGQDIVGRILGSAGNKLENVGSKMSPSPLLQRLGVQLTTGGQPSVTKQTQNENDQSQNYSSQDNTQGNVNHQQSVTQNYLTGRSPEEHYQAFQLAQQSGDKKAADQIRQMYEDEVKYQKENTGTGKKLTEKQASMKSASEGADYALNLLESGEISTGIGQKLIGSIGEKTGGLSDKQIDYRGTLAGVRTVLKNALLGSNMTPKEMESLAALIPDFDDAPSTAKQKLKTFIRESKRLSSQDIGVLQGVLNPQ